MKQKELANLIHKSNLDALLISGGNPHLVEFVPKIWQYREYISDFHSTFGNVVLTKEEELLIATDTRYELAVSRHCQVSGCSYVMKKDRNNFDEELEWLLNLPTRPKKIGIIPEILSVAQYTNFMEKALELGFEVMLVPNLVERVWDIKQEELKQAFSVADYDDTSLETEVSYIRDVLKQYDADLTVISNLETIATTIKLRGYDIPNTPLLISYLVVSGDTVILFADKRKLSNLNLDGILVYDYNDFETKIKEIAKNKKVLVDIYETTYFVYDLLKKEAKEVIFDKQEIRKKKGIKTAFQLSKLHQSAIKDGIALAKLFYYIDTNIAKGLTEKLVSDKLYELKTKLFKDFIMESFPSIVAYGENGAVIHYHTGDTKLEPKGILLVDSGSQYLTGTTDVTRTVALGPVTDKMKKAYTLVLKGHLEVARLTFTEGISGKGLDLLARKHLFSAGMDYKHGTGHGVGYISNVHETSGVGVSPLADVPIRVGTTFSNEPGYYEQGAFGIRIENVVGVIPSKMDSVETYTGENFAELMQLTMYPYEVELIDTNLLTSEEIEYINSYHKTIFDKVSPYLTDDEKTWFKTKCRTL